MRPPSETMGLAGVGSGIKSVGKPAYNGPFSDYHSTSPVQRPTHKMQASSGDIGFPTVTVTERTVRSSTPLISPPALVMRPSSVQSSPSIYPASLPAFDMEDAYHGHDEPTFPIAQRAQPASASIVPGLPPPPIPVRRRPSLTQPQQPSQNSISTASTSHAPAPVVPPRNPARRNTIVYDPEKLRVKTRVSPALSAIGAGNRDSLSSMEMYEPLTPPASSISSDSNGHRALHHETPQKWAERLRRNAASPPALAMAPAPVNPFLDLTQESPLSASQRDNFYTRRKIIEVCWDLVFDASL